MKKTFKNTGEDFSAIRAAESYLKEIGFSMGSMEGKCPIGVHQGDLFISKWTRMTTDEQNALDGALESADFREKDVILTISDGALRSAKDEA